MKFIFPQNYNFNSKILGLFDYSAAILDLIWGALIFGLVNLFLNSFKQFFIPLIIYDYFI